MDGVKIVYLPPNDWGSSGHITGNSIVLGSADEEMLAEAPLCSNNPTKTSTLLVQVYMCFTSKGW